jgi:two-component system KDP operon response regulator KdpE
MEMGMTPRILVIDDEPQIRRALKDALLDEGYNVTTAASGEEALRTLAEARPDLILLDLLLPGIDGTEFCRTARQYCHAPIVVISVRDTERDKVNVLDLGADDYLTKPFGMDELLARIRAHLRRQPSAPEPSREIRAGEITIDLERRRVTRHGEELKLTRTQYEVLRYLALNAGRVVTHGMLLQHVWGSAYDEDIGALRVHIANLRRKVEVDPSRPRLILTELGVGYRCVIPEPPLV